MLTPTSSWWSSWEARLLATTACAAIKGFFEWPRSRGLAEESFAVHWGRFRRPIIWTRIGFLPDKVKLHSEAHQSHENVHSVDGPCSLPWRTTKIPG